MTDLRLEVGEGILLQTDDAGLYDGNNETDIDELYLTNKNIIYVHEKSTGVFKSETVVDKIPLSSIAVVNGIVQIQQVDDEDYGKALQIIYTSGKRELLELNVSPKKQYPAWQSAISDAVIRLTSCVQASQEVIPPISDNSAANNVAAGIATAIPNKNIAEEKHTEKAFAGATLFAGFKGVVDAAKQTITEVTQSATEAFNGTSNNSNTQTPIIKEEPIMEEKKYIFCCNCGEKLIVGSKFCNACGTPTGTVAQKKEEPITEPVVSPVTPPPVQEPVVSPVTPPPVQEPVVAPVTPPPVQEAVEQPIITERKTVYDGAIHKCPSCGEVVNSFVSICPACGFELGQKKVSSTLEKFIDKVNECDRLIANSPNAKTGWASWSGSKKFWWVVLNIFFMCIPLVIYLVLPLVLIKSTPKLTNEEKQMVSLIENFPFPNDRESILAALVYAKEKIDFISKEKIDRKSAYWMRLWCAKAEQLKQKADMLFPNDNIVKQSYSEIIADDERVKKTIKIKAIVGLVILAIAIVFTVVRYGLLDNNNGGITDKKDYSATFEWQTNGLFAELPQPSTNNGKIVMETEKQISIELYNIETTDFEAYVKSCREAGFTVEVTKTDMVFYATDEDGYDLNIFYYDDKDLMNVVVSAYDISDGTENNDSKGE